jgi:hypothetical protein
MVKIKIAIEKAFEAYSEPEEQRDDVTMIGLRIIDY